MQESIRINTDRHNGAVSVYVQGAAAAIMIEFNMMYPSVR